MKRNTNRVWRLKSRPKGDARQEALELSEEPIPVPGEGEVLVRTVYLSMDPTNRLWMSDMDQYMEPVAIGEVMRGVILGVVEQSNNSRFAEGDMVGGLGGWADYMVANGEALNVLPQDMGLGPLDYLGVLMLVGPTAYFGMVDICNPQPGETVVVSTAAGAVGSIAGQIAKNLGCRVIGISGSDEKCKWITDELGMDVAINYKTENVLDALKKHCPDGIDCYFENVGGKILDAVLTLANLNMRIAVCGLIDQYNAIDPVPGPYMFRNVLMKRVLIKGFIVTDYADRFPEAMQFLGQAMAEGKLKYRVDVYDGLENAAKILDKLYTGDHKGKLMVKVSDEP